MPSLLETMGFELNRRDSNTLRDDVPETVSGFGDVFEALPQSSVSPSQLVPYNFGQSDYDTGVGFWIGMKNGIPKLSIGNSAGNKLTWDGTTLSVPGVSSLGGFDIGGDYIRDVNNSFGLASTVTGGDDVRFWAGDTFANRATAPFRVTEAGVVTGSNVNITGGSVVTSTLNGTIPQANLNVADKGWVQTCVFSVADLDTVAWGAGTFTSADGTAYFITGADTGNMSAKTYIYLDISVSLTAYQTTTTATTSVGVGKVLVAVAQNGAVEPTFTVMQGQGGQNIDASSIVSGSITANEIAASTITAVKMNVSSLSSMSANLGTITAGNMTIDSSGYIRTTGATNYGTGAGVWLGYDTSAYKFRVGDPAGQNMTWDGTYLKVNGSTLSNQDKFGNGSDGDVTLNATTTLTSDMFYNNLNVNGQTLNTGGYRIFCAGTLSGTGIIQNNGNVGGAGGVGQNGVGAAGGAGGTAGSAGVASAGNSVPPGLAGMAGLVGGVGASTTDAGGGLGNAGLTGTSQAKCLTAQNGKNGGTGGAGYGNVASNGGALGAGGTATGTIMNKVQNFTSFYFLSDSVGTFVNFGINPAGGSGGSGGGGNHGIGSPGAGGGGSGGSGSGGGITWISAKFITFTGTLKSLGGVGGAGGNGGPGVGGIQGGGGGAGGAGGNGGTVLVCTASTTPTYTVTVTGGAGGAKGLKGSAGVWTTDGSDGTAGNSGNSITLII